MQSGTAVVEELDDDDNPSDPSQNDAEPIVEEPDEGRAARRQPVPASIDSCLAAPAGTPDQHADAPQPTHTAAHPSLAYAQAGHGMLPGFGGLGSNSSSVYSFSSSSYTSSGGPYGVTYSATTTTRQGPGQARAFDLHPPRNNNPRSQLPPVHQHDAAC
jgi:hypothetical protein